jgi:hypothetical protein
VSTAQWLAFSWPIAAGAKYNNVVFIFLFLLLIFFSLYELINNMLSSD